MNKPFILYPSKINLSKFLDFNNHEILIGNSKSYQLGIKDNLHSNAECKFYYDGYILPINDSEVPNQVNSSSELLKYLIKNHGEKFISYIKGIFCIFLIYKNSVHVYTDQLGIYKLYYYQNSNEVLFSNSLDLFKEARVPFEIDEVSMIQKSLLHRTTNGYTIFQEIKYTPPASHYIISTEGFSHNTYWDYKQLYQNNKAEKSANFEKFAQLFCKSFENHQKYLSPVANAMTLTGGKDSRTGLAVLLHLGIKPAGFTYGNELSRDSVYARNIADFLNLEHKIINPTQTIDWFDESARIIIQSGNSEINIHRSHRMYAFSKIAKLLGHDTAYYGGYLGGEFLMGLYYDNLQFTDFLTDFWNSSSLNNTDSRIRKYFHRTEDNKIRKVYERLNSLNCFNPDQSLEEKQFHALFEIAIPHHAQDLQLAHQFLDYPIPFFLDIDFLEMLFRSGYNFTFRNNKSKNLLKRYELFEFNLKLQHILYPDLDHLPFAKRGSYTTSEFLNGKFYWSLLKGLRFFLERKKYPVTFAYQPSYKEFLLKYLNNLMNDSSNILHDVYDVNKAISSLNSEIGLTREGQLHCYSNIVMHYMQINQYTK